MPSSPIVSIDQAVALLKRGDVVAIPTETVYGLAASIADEQALRKIFSTKARPFFDPLIVHVSSVDQARSFSANWSPVHDSLAKAFWPGPLTIVTEKKGIADLITSGLETVGLRIPAHPMAQEIISKLGTPLAAPSANKFGKTSPTTAAHVVDEYQGAVSVVDGGPCQVGVESTILRISEIEGEITVHILRSGQILPSSIERVLKGFKKRIVFNREVKKIEAPGQVEHHYMPPIPVVFVSNPEAFNIAKFQSENLQLKIINNLDFPEDANLAARMLYSQLRDLSANADAIMFMRKAKYSGEAWDAILDRLWRASSIRP